MLLLPSFLLPVSASASHTVAVAAAAAVQLRFLYSQLLRTPLECSDLVWERLKALVERGSSSSIKSRRGPRPGVHADGDGSIKGASTLFDVYDLLADELLPELLQRLRQQKSSTLEELQLSPERAGAEQQPKSDDPAAARAAIKERGNRWYSFRCCNRRCCCCYSGSCAPTCGKL